MEINPKVVCDRFEDEIVVVSLETGFYYSFRKSAFDIWCFLEEGLSSSQIIDSFHISPDQKNDLTTFIDQLIDEKLIIPTDDSDKELQELNQIDFKEIEFAKFEDMSDLIMIDPIHDADQQKGWPHKSES